MEAQARDFLTDSERDEQESSEDTAWGDNFIQIAGSWYGKREEIHTRCNTCEAHTDQIIYQNEDDETYIYLCSCWTDTNMERDPRAVIQLRTYPTSHLLPAPAVGPSLWDSAPGLIPACRGLPSPMPGASRDFPASQKKAAFKSGKDGGYICLLEVTNKIFIIFL